jgi:hypothetical protein
VCVCVCFFFYLKNLITWVRRSSPKTGKVTSLGAGSSSELVGSARAMIIVPPCLPGGLGRSDVFDSFDLINQVQMEARSLGNVGAVGRSLVVGDAHAVRQER